MAFRLINTSTLTVEPVRSLSIPEYAILSHTWVRDEEVSYLDMVNISTNPTHPAKQRSGYQKIIKTCEIARQHHLEYAWIDTCCIDQSSSADLSEAINSMFQWYSSANICLAYLSDLQLEHDLHNNLPRCGWFTRGWCLQELIAPRNVRFYNSHWKFIGTKTDSKLQALVSRISGIEERVLIDPSILPNLPVAQKMSWAANRITTKEEDRAYCLLGIFDVNMPLIYGEGRKAFMRLQETIIQKSNDLSIFAWGHPLTTTPQQLSIGGNGAEQSESPTSQTPHCDLFATTPDDFSGCKNLVLHSGAARRNFAFSMTNNGVLLSRIKIQLSFTNDCYLIPLHCYDSGLSSADLYLALKKVGPDLYVRIRNCNWTDLFGWSRRIDGFVLRNITPEIRNLLEMSEVNAVELWSPSFSKEALHASILDISNFEDWDASRLAFLGGDEPPLSGHVKFHHKMLRKALAYSTDVTSDDFYVVWGTLVVQNAEEFARSRETRWVRLYWAEEWHGRSELKDHILLEAEPNIPAGLERDIIRRGPEVVEATVSTIGDIGRMHFSIKVQVSTV